MMTVTTTKLQPGDVILIDGYARTLVEISKAWKAPEYHLLLQWSSQSKVVRSYHSNKKFTITREAK
jgi:hypothetical protein